MGNQTQYIYVTLLRASFPYFFTLHGYICYNSKITHYSMAMRQDKGLDTWN